MRRILCVVRTALTVACVCVPFSILRAETGMGLVACDDNGSYSDYVAGDIR
jgi:hypothetical protein